MSYQKVQNTDEANIDIQINSDEDNIDIQINSDEYTNDNICKYCHEPDGEMIKPCKCNDRVHLKCLTDWHKSRPGNKNTCEICKEEYYGKKTFDRNKCLIDFLYFPCMIILNLFVIVGCAGYDTFNKLSEHDATPFGKVLSVSLPISVAYSLFFCLALLGLWLAQITGKKIDEFKFGNGEPIKIISYCLIFNISAQIIPVIVCSIILKEFFWNMTTFGLSLMFILGICIICLMIGMIGYCIIKFTEFISHNYVKITYDNIPETQV